MDNSVQFERAAGIIAGSDSLLVITGAGISAESGVPTYRDEGGIYDDPDRMLYDDDLKSDPLKIWKNVDGGYTAK